MYITYKYLLKPNKYQRKAIDKTIEYANRVKNLCIENNEEKFIKHNAKGLVDKYILQNPEFKRCDYSALMNSLFDLDDAETKYRSSKCSYVTTYSNFLKENFPVNDRKVFLPKIGWISYKMHRNLPDLENIVKVAVKKDKLDKYYVFFICLATVAKKENLDANKSVGLDYSSTYFIVDSNGIKYPIEHFYRDAEKKKNQLKKELSRKNYGSRKYLEIEKQILKLEKHTVNKRKDTLHKLSEQLSNKYDYIYVETISMKCISNHNHLSKATYDNSYYMFLNMLDYKMKKKGKKLIKIDRWYPSSKMCSNCGYINKALKLSERKWRCINCGVVHDRDINAAINIKEEGKRLISAGLADHS